MRHTKTVGLTLVEILIAMSLLAIMTGFVVSSLAGSFQITRASRKVLDATSSVQRVLEDVRGQWQMRDRYNPFCAIVDLTPDASPFLTLTATNLSLTASAGTVSGALPEDLITSSCVVTPASPAPACITAMRRVVVTAVDTTDSNKVLARAALDVVCP